MKTFDPFRKQKKEAFLSSLASVIILGDHVWQQCQMRNLSQLAMKEELLRLIKVIFKYFCVYNCNWFRPTLKILFLSKINFLFIFVTFFHDSPSPALAFEYPHE
jgi:hypothetical protein